MKNKHINKTVLSNKVSLSEKGLKYFISYKDAKNTPSITFLPANMSAYRRYFDETKYRSFSGKDHEFLEKYNGIWEKVKNSNKKEFDSEPVYNEKDLKAKKKKSYNGKITTNFHNNEIPKEGSQFTCLSVILIGFVFITGKNYYPHMLLEECKYVVIEKTMSEYIAIDIKISPGSVTEDPDGEI